MDTFDLIDKIRESAPRFQAEGKSWYVLERDLQVEESELLGYVEDLVAAPKRVDGEAPERLNGATVGGRFVRWAPNTQLTWRVMRDSFPDDVTFAEAHRICRAATSDWNNAVDRERFDFRFVEVGELEDSHFRFEYQVFESAGLYAVAFFPNDPANKRVVRIGPPTFKVGAAFDPVGVIRHELGHVIGFRHEQIREDAGLGIAEHVMGDFGDKPIGAYDCRSVMHYPIESRGTTTFELTPLDIEGFCQIYTLSEEEVQEYNP